MQSSNGTLTMLKEQEILIQLLQCLVQDKKYKNTKEDSINWQGVIEEAKEHQVLGMIYPVIDHQEGQLGISQDICELWKKQTFLTAVRQMRHINEIARLLGCFKEAHIPIIVLKGLVIRNYYPRPELRTMCDADLLIKEGYKPQETSVVHIQYIHPKGSVVEIHWTIRDERIFDEVEQLETHLWEEARPVQVGDVEVLSLGLEDLMVHICVHMATHLCVGGFGIRQVLDLAMMVKQKESEIDWQRFIKKVQVWKIEQFTATIFKVVWQLFKVSVPVELEQLGYVNEKTTQQLIEDIMASGVHGKRNSVQVISSELAKDLERRHHKQWVWMNYLRYIFPSASRISDKYQYVKKHKWLLPIAWIQHLWNGIRHKEYKKENKFNFLVKALKQSYKRNRLLKQLKL